MGVPYSVFDIVSGETITKPFSHNGFLMIWYKFGLIGLVALVFVWGRGLWVGIRTLWQQRVAGRWRLYGLMMVVSLAAMLPSANTSLPFYTSDTGLAFTIVVGVSMGLHWRKSKAV
jgi:O-antigen ligase